MPDAGANTLRFAGEKNALALTIKDFILKPLS
jgi:hypothetical protein